MSEDIKRLHVWMTENNLNLKQLAQAMDIPYITVHTIVSRRKFATDQFVTRFIRSFGYDDALEVFQEHLAPVVIG